MPGTGVSEGPTTRLVLQMIEKWQTAFSHLHGKKLLLLGQRGVTRIIYTVTRSKQEAHSKQEGVLPFFFL